MFRILVADKLGDVGLERLNQVQDATYDSKTDLAKEELLEIIPEYDALIVRSGTKVDADVLKAGKNLKLVGRAGIGVDNIDVKAATLRGIIVMNTPQANAIATAEQTMALILAASRFTAVAHASLKAGEWRRSDFTGWQLYRKTLGIVGFGRIGRLVAQRAQAFGMEVLAYDPFVSEEVGHDLGVTLVDLDDLLAQADYITLHTVLTPETEHMINAEVIRQMKDGVILINTARGKLIDEQALAEALQRGQVRAAGVDVYSNEPPADNPLIGLSNVVHTPHLGATTAEAQRDVAIQIVDQVMDALRGTDFRNTVNMPFHAGPDFATTRPYMELAEKLGILQSALSASRIRRVEIEVRGETVDRLVKPVAAALLKGLLQRSLAESVNYINAPILAEEDGMSISQTKGMSVADYPNLISCRVYWHEGQRLLAGAIFGSGPRIVQVDDYHLEAKPDGVVLVMQNRDVPGVIGQVGTILAAYDVNIGEWRMGRHEPGGEALSFINLDSELPPPVLQALEKIPAVTGVKLVNL
ncbi:MAG: phosphoglycerate dehydrogenase [Chloroflexi bacterium]|nr:phosphoglycerate dehydrogenase [Chloroflexota bacterium]MCI0577623.1 phosphoglycerate dehydrogenase [Chloroflexota bacterium]MCI0644157.1 phosphoglycerate dehydrogenase [Chloroflexota bacterium]MCI0725260.1 phosphoglycerate dehydrogenase [Chloroflexota bacterium]